MKSLISILTFISASLFLTASLAHHAQSFDFDKDTKMTLAGKVVKLDWINPHVVIHLEVIDGYGLKTLRLIQGGTPNTLLQRGLNRRSFDSQYTVSLEVHPPTNPTCPTTCFYHGINITLSSGGTVPLGNLDDIQI